VAYRDVSGYGNRHALIAAVVPAGAVTTHTLFCANAALTTEQSHLLCALLNSHVLNALARMLMGSHVTTSLVEQLPVPPLAGAEDRCRRIARLTQRLSRATVPRVEAAVQAEVALLYKLKVDEYQIILERGCRLTPDQRNAALAAFARRSVA
jgi:hypothetical protein